MNLGNFKLVFVGFLVHFVLAVFIFIIDRFFSYTTSLGPYIHIGGTFALCGAAFGFFVVLVRRLSKIRTWEFYVQIFPLFLCSCLDMWTSIGFYTSPNDWHMPNFIHEGGQVLESVWVQIVTILNGTLLLLLNYVVVYKYYNRQSWRSLGLFITTFWVTMSIIFTSLHQTMTAPISILHKSFLILIPYFIIMFITVITHKRAFTFRGGSKTQNFQSQASSLDFLTVALMIFTIFIYFAKFLVSLGFAVGFLEVFEDTDPMLLFVDVDDAVAAGTAHSWLSMVLVVPFLILGILNMVGGEKKAIYLWDVAIIQTAIIVLTQGYSIMGAFHWGVPDDLKVEGPDTIFWIVNLIPLLSTTLYLDYLSRDRVKGTGGFTINRKNK